MAPQGVYTWKSRPTSLSYYTCKVTKSVSWCFDHNTLSKHWPAWPPKNILVAGNHAWSTHLILDSWVVIGHLYLVARPTRKRYSSGITFKNQSETILEANDFSFSRKTITSVSVPRDEKLVFSGGKCPNQIHLVPSLACVTCNRTLPSLCWRVHGGNVRRSLIYSKHNITAFVKARMRIVQLAMF